MLLLLLLYTSWFNNSVEEKLDFGFENAGLATNLDKMRPQRMASRVSKKVAKSQIIVTIENAGRHFKR